MARTKQDIYRQIDEWQKKNMKRVVLKLNVRTDADIIAELETKDSKQGYIKEAIRNYMK